MSTKPFKNHQYFGKASQNERGNVFFALFGAIAIVGILGAVIMTTMRGPLSTMVEVNRKEQAKAELRVAASLVLVDAANHDYEVECEGGAADGYTEGPAPSAGTGPTGGGLLPVVGAAQNDPWGNAYGYCAWDHGPDAAGSNAGGGCGTHLQGNTNTNNIAIAVMSAGPNGVFDTDCIADGAAADDYVAPDEGAVDDIVVSMTYNQAISSSGGLWNIKSGDPNVAEIAKNIEVTGTATFTDDLNLTNASAQLQLGAASMLLPDEAVLVNCTAGNNLLLRLNDGALNDQEPVLQVCDGSVPAWVNVGGGRWKDGAAGEIYYDTANVGVGTVTDPARALDVGGTFGATGAVTLGSTLGVTGATTLSSTLGVTGATTLSSTLGVTGATTLSSTLGVVGAGDFDSTLNVDGNATLNGSLDVDGVSILHNNVTITGSTSDATADALTVEKLDGTDILVVQNDGFVGIGNATPNDALDVTGNIDATGTLNITGESTLGDNVTITGDTADGSTNPLTIKDSGAVTVGTIDSDGNVNVNGNGIFGGDVTADNYKMPSLTQNFSTVPDCDAAGEKVIFTAGTGWACGADQNDGSGGSPAAAGADRDIQFNNAGVLGGSTSFKYMSDGDLLLSGTYTGTASVPATGAGTRMFFDVQKGAIRAGSVSGTQWDNASIGNRSVAMGNDVTANGLSATALGLDATASGSYSTAIGWYAVSSATESRAFGTRVTAAGDTSMALGGYVNVNSSGDGSMGIGLTTTDPPTDPIVSGAQSLGIFMGSQSAVNFAAANTMGVFGGKLVIDPAVPATQLTARTVLDLGAATDAVVMPSGNTAARPAAPVNGMFRYNSANGKFEGYQGGAWQDILTSASTGTTALSSLTAGTATNTIDSLNFAQVWGWSTLSTETAMSMNANALTSGNILDLASSATGMTGALEELTLSGSNAANTGSVLTLNNTGVLNTGTSLLVQHNATGAGTLALRVNDVAGDTTPFVIDGDGNVGVGVPTPPSKFVVAPPATETIAAAGTITADACGTIKQIQSTGSVTTNTTDTFTSSTASYAGCCMDVVNVDAADTVTLDDNAKFLTGGGANIALAPNKSVRVCSDGTNWYQAAAVSSVAGAGSNAIDDLSDAETDYATDFNMFLGVERLPSVGGQYNIGLGQTAGDAITTGDYNIAIGYNALTAMQSGQGNIAIGVDALLSDTNVIGAIAIGSNALENNDGNPNIGIGLDAGRYNGTGSDNTALGFMALKGVAGNNNNGNTAIGSNAMVSVTTGSSNTVLGSASGSTITSGGTNILIGYDVEPPAATTDNHLNIGGTIYGDMANDRVRIGGSGAVSAGPLYAAPPATETIAAAGTITADACGTIKQIQSTGSVTTNTTDTFTSSTPSGCCMDVVNVDAADTVTLDDNAKFLTAGGANIALGPNDMIRVCSNGTNWYQAEDKVSSVGGATALSAITVATGTNTIDSGTHAQEWQWNTLAGNSAMKLSSTSTAAAGDAQKMFEVALSGANGTAGQSTYGAYITNTHTGATSENVGLYVSASGATNNYAAIFANGNVGIGTSAPVYPLETNGIIGLQTASVNNDNTLPGNSTAQIAITNTTTADNLVSSIMFYEDAGAPVGALAVETVSNALPSGQMIFYTRGTTGFHPNMVLDTEGRLGIGAQGGFFVMTPSYDLSFEGDSAARTIGVERETSNNTAGRDLTIAAGGADAGSNNLAGGSLVLSSGTTTGNGASSIVFQTVVANQGTGSTDRSPATSMTLASNALSLPSAASTAEAGQAGMQAAANGMIYYNSTTNKFRGYENGAWTDMIGSVSGSLDNLTDSETDYATDFNMFIGVERLPSVGGQYNIGLGQTAGDSITTGDGNIAIGYDALTAINDDLNNIAIGLNALNGMTDGNYNVAIGYSSMDNANTSVFNNVAFGYNTLGTTTGDNNTAIGHLSQQRDAGNSNASLGTYSLRYFAGASGNTAVGYSALLGVDGSSTGGSNTVLGYQAGDSITTGASNILIGYDVDTPAVSTSNHLNIGGTIFGDVSTDNVRIGGSGAVSAGPLYAVPPASEAIAGAGTITANACGTIKQITSVGSVTTNTTDTFTASTPSGCCMDVVNVDAADTITLDDNAKFLTAGGANVALAPNDMTRVCSNGTNWYQAEDKVTGAAGSLAIDDLTDAYTIYDAGTTSNFIMGRAGAAALAAGATTNLFIGELAGATTVNSTATTDVNTAVGYQALSDMTSGHDNNAFGYGAAGDCTTCYENVALGENAVGGNVGAPFTGYYNVGVGNGSLMSLTSGYYNTAIGDSALSSLDTGNTNVAVGRQALMTVMASTANVAVGESAMASSDTDNANVAIGKHALYTITGGGNDENTAVGNYAMSDSTTGTKNVGVGAGVMWNGTTGSRNVAVGYTALTTVTGVDNTVLGYNAASTTTSGDRNIILGSGVNASSATVDDELNIGGTIYGDMANDRVRIGGSGAVSVGPLYAAPPATETIAAAGTITADACGTIKPLQSTGSVTTNTTDTFTASTPSGCCMDVVNVDAADTITLDDNAKFLTAAGANVALAPNDMTRVCSNGTNWYQAEDKVTVAAGSIALDDLSDTETDYATNFNMSLGSEHLPSAAGQYNISIGQNAADSLTSGGTNIAIGYNALTATTDERDNIAIGKDAMLSATGSRENIILGTRAMEDSTTGDNNVMIGYRVGDGSTGSSNILIGSQAATPASGTNSWLNIGDTINADLSTDNVSIGGTTTTYDLTMDGDTAAQTIGMNRETTNLTAGRNLTIVAGGADSGSSDLAGGSLVLSAGLATGNGSSSILFQTVLETQGAGSTDRTPATSMTLSSGALTIPTGTEAQRPGTPANGMMRYKTDVGTSAIGFEVREGGAWVAMGASASDVRLKHDIAPLDSETVLERLSQVQGVSYRLKAEGEAGRTHYGVIAQDLEKIFPELVNGGNTPEDMKSVRYLEMTGLLIEAAKGLKDENDMLKGDVAKMSKTLEGLSQKVANLDTAQAVQGPAPSSGPDLWMVLLAGFTGAGVMLVGMVLLRKR